MISEYYKFLCPVMRLCPLANSVVCKSVEKSATIVGTIKMVQFRVPKYIKTFVCIVVNCLMCIVVVVLCVLLSSYVYLLYYACIAVFTLDSGLLARSQYSEGPATDHLDTDFSCFPCVYKQMLRWFPRFQVATTCFSCIPPDLNLLVTNFIFCIHVK